MPEECVLDSPYMESLIYEFASLYADGTYKRYIEDRQAECNTKERQDLYLKPFHAAQVIAPQLSEVKISAWTTVCDADGLMRDILKAWLCCEYQFTAALQKDLFLEDLASRRRDFCSSLLVNMTMGYACVIAPQGTWPTIMADAMTGVLYWILHSFKVLGFEVAHVPFCCRSQAIMGVGG